MNDLFAFLGSLPFGKLAYTVILVALLTLLGRETWTLWFDQRVYIGAFDYFKDGKIEADQATAFPRLVLAQHQMLRSAILDEQKQEQRRRLAQDNAQRGLPAGARVQTISMRLFPQAATTGLSSWKTLLADAEIKVQGFEVGKLLSQLRAWVSPPNEVKGIVESTAGTVRSTFSWPASIGAENHVAGGQIETGPLGSDSSAALAVAANLIWAQTASGAGTTRLLPRDTYVTWITVSWEYRQARDKKAVRINPDDAEKQRWARTRALVDTLMPSATEHPTIWRLRAEIIELAYAGAVTTDEQAIADADWARFAQSQGTSVELARLAARGEAAAAATGAPTKSGVQPTSRRLSAPTLVWYGSGEGAAAARSAVTATAVVLDATGARRLVLPDYVLNGVGPNEVLRFSLAPGEPAVAEARAADIVRPEGGAAGVARPGVVMARILPTADKLLATASVVRTLAEAGPRPGAGETLTISTQQRQSEVTVAAVASDDGGLLPVDRKVTEGGDGGAPVVDSQGRLVAMAYLASPERSYFLPLAWLWGPGARYTLAR